jgi:hypothetical protein
MADYADEEIAAERQRHPLMRVDGEGNVAPVFEVSDEMVERAARAEHAHAGHTMPSGRLSSWDMLTPYQRGQFRIRARRVLTAAFDGGDQ